MFSELVTSQLSTSKNMLTDAVLSFSPLPLPHTRMHARTHTCVCMCAFLKMVHLQNAFMVFAMSLHCTISQYHLDRNLSHFC